MDEIWRAGFFRSMVGDKKKLIKNRKEEFKKTKEELKMNNLLGG